MKETVTLNRKEQRRLVVLNQVEGGMSQKQTERVDITASLKIPGSKVMPEAMRATTTITYTDPPF